MTSVKIKFGDREFDIPRLNIGQLERYSEVEAAQKLDGTQTAVNMKTTFALIKIALERATPKIANINEIEATPEELGVAAAKILICAGLAKAKPPNEVAPRTTRGKADKTAATAK